MRSIGLDANKVYLVTGAAGFIGYYLCRRLLDKGCRVIGIDNLNDYYDVELKYARLDLLVPYKQFTFLKKDLADQAGMMELFALYRPHVVVNLAAQAGVRYSLENPDAYMQSNVMGFYHVLEACRHYPVEHLIYASSSSVYGANRKVPFEETDRVDRPVSLYASTKKTNELMAYTYSHLYGIPATGLRFFTVYGPMGRPDMAYFDFADKYFSGEPIAIYNDGDFERDLYRDFTYIDDIIEGIERLIARGGVHESNLVRKIDCGGFADEVPHRVYNIGNNEPIKLMTFIETLERALSEALGQEVVFEKRFEPLKPGDVTATYASTDRLHEAVGFKPKTPIAVGLQRFADWYVDYYKKRVSAEVMRDFTS